MHKEQQATSTAGFQPGDQVRFTFGYEKTFIGDGIFTVLYTKVKNGQTLVKLKGVSPLFSEMAIEKANADVMDVETMFKAIEYCFTEESCLKCPLAGEQESCPKKWQEALKAYKQQVEKDILAYKRELAVFNTAIQHVVYENTCATCAVKNKCPSKAEAEKAKKRNFETCVQTHRVVFDAFYRFEPKALDYELSGKQYKEDDCND